MYISAIKLIIMKKIICLLIIAFSVLQSCESKNETTYYLIRHAEKDRTDANNRNPDLNEKGKERAKKWAEFFEDKNIDLVYSTNYNRTIQTATPTAESKGLEIKKYDPRNMYSDDFQKATKGKSVLVVGHSNTTPFFANKILGEDNFEQMDDNDNATLFKVTLSGIIGNENKQVEVKKINP